ncbi:hypothetical protein BCR44DRAFT_1430658 [Catenaria anguillulae PL171]|uniref:Uncharacterized protein n=1 Tax=Catenaria anguillulae PL171 TaxID=765915 RepID=A0A1Y2HU20_9FUNG|nr:hypothetical protein BCR44DRAFT_1430658 [Catenaria anguillulae PL171]
MVRHRSSYTSASASGQPHSRTFGCHGQHGLLLSIHCGRFGRSCQPRRFTLFLCLARTHLDIQAAQLMCQPPKHIPFVALCVCPRALLQLWVHL